MWAEGKDRSTGRPQTRRLGSSHPSLNSTFQFLVWCYGLRICHLNYLQSWCESLFKRTLTNQELKWSCTQEAQDMAWRTPTQKPKKAHRRENTNGIVLVWVPHGSHSTWHLYACASFQFSHTCCPLEMWVFPIDHAQMIALSGWDSNYNIIHTRGPMHMRE